LANDTSRAISQNVVATGLWPVNECSEYCYDWTAHRAVATGFCVKQDFGRRPPRLGRLFDTSPLYFVTFCTYLRKPFLARDEVHAAFVASSERAQRDFNVAVGCDVIMPDHVHLFVRGSKVFGLGSWVGLLKQALAKAASCLEPRPSFERKGFSITFYEAMSYSQKWNYVRENPVRAGLVKSVEDWPYQGEIVYIDRA
jgi:putative transposase